ncbi:signal peptidase I [Bacteroidia bacterium]|nr:signal peptidase I [Bacteroidia bacterium]
MKKSIKNILYYLTVFFIAILLAIALRIFFIASFKIPTSSMEPVISPGDYILVNKQIPGPRMIPNFFSRQENEAPEIKRLQGIRKIRRNDVLVFNFPYEGGGNLHLDLNIYYVKRCVAIPGDTFRIENGLYEVNSNREIAGNREAQSAFSHCPETEMPPEIFRCFPFDSAYNWNVKSFGPLYVPQKGDTIRIDEKNRLLYCNLIQYETGKEVPDDLQSYVFQQNYYFMAGDHVFDSRDSRYWGLLPEDHIVGKAILIWKSKDMHTGKYRWKRFFKAVK